MSPNRALRPRSKTTITVTDDVREQIWAAQLILLEETRRGEMTVSEALGIMAAEFLAAREARQP